MRLLILLTVSAAALTACTWNVDMRPDAESDADEATERAAAPFVVQGQLFYPERVALPGDAELVVGLDAVRAGGRTPLTRFSNRLGGQQVPIPLRFSVEPENAEPAIYELSAAVLAGDRLLRLTGPIVVRPEDAGADVGRVRLYAPLEIGFGTAWQCAGHSVLLGAVERRLFMAFDERLMTVERLPSDAGVLYQTADPDTPGLLDRDGDISLLTSGEKTLDCDPVPAVEAPVSGGGNEPGWRVEVGPERIELTSDYGQTFTRARLLGSGASGLTTRFRGLGEHGPILAAFQRRICRDSATGMPHPHSVEVQFEGGRLQGCGGEPRDLLTGTTWHVALIDGDALASGEDGDDTIEVTLQFDADGRLNGRAGCNRYSADYQLSGEALTVGPVASSKMACPGEAMAIEERFLGRLTSTRRFDIGEAGELILIGDAGRITAADQGR